jgi:hypothetical protein
MLILFLLLFFYLLSAFQSELPCFHTCAKFIEPAKPNKQKEEK